MKATPEIISFVLVISTLLVGLIFLLVMVVMREPFERRRKNQGPVYSGHLRRKSDIIESGVNAAPQERETDIK